MVRELFRDAAAVIGFAALCWGIYLIHPPSALIVGGGLLLTCSVVGSLRNS